MSTLSLAGLPLSDDPTTVLAHYPASIAGLPITVLPIPATGELIDDFHPTSRIFVAQQGRGMRWYRQGKHARRMHTAPRMIEMYEQGLSFDHCQWQGKAGRCARLEFADADVQALTHGELQSLRLQTQHELFDERVSRITLELADEALRGLPSGRLYVQGLCVALLGTLYSRYASGRDTMPSSVPRRFGLARQQRLIDLIEQQLGSQLSLVRLAQEVGLSPHHFARIFKETFGTTPHQYVQERRIDLAATALRQGDCRPLADIAVAYGFANQSHMTALMRSRLGITPGMLRRGAGASDLGRRSV